MIVAAAADTTEVQRRIAAVRRPRPVLDRARAEALTARQRELLDELSELFSGGFAHLTMAEIAAALNCSLRTLYGLAPSREELVLMVVDRRLWDVGRTARQAVPETPVSSAVDAIRAYLAAAHVAVSRTTEAFARDMATVPGGAELAAAHSNYLVAVTTELLDWAVERREIAPVDTAALAHVVAGLGRTLTRPEVIASLASTPREATDHLVDVILRGLTAGTGRSRRASHHPDPSEK